MIPNTKVMMGGKKKLARLSLILAMGKAVYVTPTEQIGPKGNKAASLYYAGNPDMLKFVRNSARQFVTPDLPVGSKVISFNIFRTLYQLKASFIALR